MSDDNSPLDDGVEKPEGLREQVKEKLQSQDEPAVIAPALADEETAHDHVIDAPTRLGDNPGKQALFWLIAMALASDAINRRAGVEKLEIDIFDNPGNVVTGVRDFCRSGGLLTVSILPHEFARADDIEKVLECFCEMAECSDEILQAVIDFDEEDEKADCHNEDLDRQLKILFYAWILRVQDIEKELEAIFGQFQGDCKFFELMSQQTQGLIAAIEEHIHDALTLKYNEILAFAKEYNQTHDNILSPCDALDFVLGSNVLNDILAEEQQKRSGNEKPNQPDMANR